jgi:hypothetical protein
LVEGETRHDGNYTFTSLASGVCVMTSTDTSSVIGTNSRTILLYTWNGAKIAMFSPE